MSRGGQARKLDMPPITQVVGGYPVTAALTASGDVFTVDPDKGTVTKLKLSGVRQLTTLRDTGNPDPWYGLRDDGTVVQGTGKATHPFNEVKLPFADIAAIAASNGLWLLRADGTVWSVDIDYESPTSSEAESTAETGDHYDVPRNVKAVPVQGLADVAHLWNGIGTAPIAETKDGTLWELEPRASNDQPAALPLQAPGGPAVQLADVGVTWVALDAKGHLWYWPAGVDNNSDSDRYRMLVDSPPQRLVGPTVGTAGRIVVSPFGMIGADGSRWIISQDDSGTFAVANVTDGAVPGSSWKLPPPPVPARSILFASEYVFAVG